MQANGPALLMGLYSILLRTLNYEDTKQLDTYILDDDLKPWIKITPGFKEVVSSYVKDEEMDLVPLGQGLKVVIEQLQRNPNMPSLYLDSVKAFALYFRTQSEGAYRRLEKLSVSLRQPWLSAFFSKEVRSQAPLIKALQGLVKRLTGKPAKTLTTEQSISVKENRPDDYKEYLRLRREYNLVWKDALSSFVRESGANTVPMKQAEKFLAKKGMETTLPTGFTGRVDAQGQWYTEFDEPISGGAPQSFLFPTVKMNPNYKKGSAESVFTSIREDGSSGAYYYTVQTLKTVTEQKFSNVKSLTSRIPKIRAKWVALIKQFDETKPNTVGAVVLELLYQFHARVGSSPMKHNGLSTLMVKQYYPQTDGSFVLRYLGKDGVKTVHRMRPVDPLSKLLCKCVARLAAGKKPSEFLFTFQRPSGARLLYGPNKTNQLFHQLGAPEGTTVHKLRTYTATKIFRQLMLELFEKKAEFKDVKKANEAFLKMAVQAGKALNHVRTKADGTVVTTPATVLKSYIDVDAQLEFFEHYKLAIPKYLEKLVKSAEASGTEDEDEDPESSPEQDKEELQDMVDKPALDRLFSEWESSQTSLDSDPTHPDNLLRGAVDTVN